MQTSRHVPAHKSRRSSSFVGENLMGLASKYLQLEKELNHYNEFLANASRAMRDNDVSNYPIFVAFKDQIEIELGLKLIEKTERKSEWNIHISSLEEFVAKSLIMSEKIDDFKKVYKDPDESLCIFVLSELGASFIYLPIKPTK